MLSINYDVFSIIIIGKKLIKFKLVNSNNLIKMAKRRRRQRHQKKTGTEQVPNISVRENIRKRKRQKNYDNLPLKKKINQQLLKNTCFPKELSSIITSYAVKIEGKYRYSFGNGNVVGIVVYDNKLFMIDNLGEISIYNLNGKFLRCINKRITNIRNIAVYEDKIYVASTEKIVVLNIKGKFLFCLAENIVVFNIAFYKDEIFVTYSEGVCVLDLEGNFLRKWGRNFGKNCLRNGCLRFLSNFWDYGYFNNPWGIAIANDEVFVVDKNRHHVIVFDINGKYLRQFGKNGREDGELRYPRSIAVSGGEVFISDTFNKRISVFNIKGNFSRYIDIGEELQNHVISSAGDKLYVITKYCLARVYE